MAPIQLLQVGCGGMGLRHIYGLIELRERGFDSFDLIALCDRNASSAEYVAGVAEKGLGIRPRIYSDSRDMLDTERSAEAVNIVTDTAAHHELALLAFEAGLHVVVEKPMALTVRACRTMISASKSAGLVLSVSENYRRDPINRMTKALLESGIIGDIRLAINLFTMGGSDVRQAAAWRHLKNRGGMILDYGVHVSDLTLYMLGDVERVYAETHLWQKTRKIAEPPDRMRKFYQHRVKEDFEEESSIIEASSEDTGVAVLRFTSGAIGQITYSDASPGESSDTDIIYGSKGSLRLSVSRSGQPVKVTFLGRSDPVDSNDLLSEIPNFRLDEVTSRVFGSGDRIYEYDSSFDESDRKLIAVELQDFYGAVTTGRSPEVSGDVGLDAVALSYAILESGHLSRPVVFNDVRQDRINSYQQEINEIIAI